jgi:hypothetical protein
LGEDSQVIYVDIFGTGREHNITCHKKKPENLGNFLTSVMEKETFSASES